MKLNGMEVFQDLSVDSLIDIKKLREKIIKQVGNGWTHDKKRENTISDEILADDDVIVFHRNAFDDVDESILILWQKQNSYYVTNIVPSNVGELGVSKYNIIINDFVDRVISPLKEKGDLDFKLSTKLKNIEDWLDMPSANALISFSKLANKSTRASHPSDQKRWVSFLIQAHQSSATLDSSELFRWLVEVGKWPDEIASDLAIDYEFSRELLKEYDKR